MQLTYMCVRVRMLSIYTQMGRVCVFVTFLPWYAQINPL